MALPSHRVGLALALLAWLGAPLGAAAEHIYSWTDKEGVVHVTNVPPSDSFDEGRVGKDGTIHVTNLGSGAKRSGRTHREPDPEIARYQPGPERAPLDFQPNDITAQYDPFIKEACERYQIPPPLVRAIMNAESNFDPRAMSQKGATGLMQLMPTTGDEMRVANLTDPRDNILGGVRYLRVLTNLFDGDMVKIVAAYNAGPRAVWDAGGVPEIPETQDYVRKVIRLYFSYKNPSH